MRHIALLRCFEAAARHQSYSLAAKELAVSQAAVSQQIRNLESHLSVTLFKRHGRTMQLPPQGQTLHEHVATAFESILRGLNQIQQEPEEGELVVTTAMSFASIWLVPRLWKFAEHSPGIKIKVMVSSELEDIRHSNIDVAIRQGDSNAEDVTQEELLVDPVFPVCSPRLIESLNLRSPEQISCCQLVEVEDPGRFSWKNWCDATGVEYHPEHLSWIEAISWEMGLNLVTAGQGLFLTSALMANELIEKGFLARPFDQQIEPGLRFSFLYDPESPRLQRVMRFRSWLRTELDSIA